MFVLKVRLSVVTNDPVCVSRRVGLLIRAGNLSAQIIVKSLEQTFAQVHVADWVDSFRELNTARQLPVSVTPLVLNSLHVPLVDQHDDLVSLSAVNLLKQFVVTFINEYFFEFGEEDVCRLDEPVQLVLVQALFGESSRTNKAKLDSVTGELI